MAKLLVGDSYGDDVRKLLRADDMFISGGDIAFAGAAIGAPHPRVDTFAAHIASLSHILTRIVLSERLVFVYSPGGGAEDPPTSFLLPLIEQHCDTVQIDQSYQLVSPVIHHALATPADVFGEDLVESVSSTVRRYAPWTTWTTTDKVMARALLAEYGAASLLGAPYAPNPFISQPFSIHAYRGATTAEELLRYVEDLRLETSRAMNLHKRLNVYDLRLPAILVAVLRESREPADLVRVASQMSGEASAFRAWCRSLDSIESRNPDKYLNQLRAAEDSLRRLGSSLGAPEGDRMQVSLSAGPFGLKLATPTLRKIFALLDVDVRFYRPRSFLLNVLASARQVRRLAPEIARVFDVSPNHASAAADHFLALAETSEIR
jgi:hypothetical protein